MSASVDEIFIDELNLIYDPNPIFLNTTSILSFLANLFGFGDFPISIESIGGNITVDDIGYDYAGGNATIQVLAHNPDYSQNVTRNVTYYYSRWDYDWMPEDVEWVYFSPSSPTAKNVTPFGQTDTVPLLNITNYGYGGKNASLSVYVNDSLECVNMTMSLTNNKDDGSVVNESWIDLTDMAYLNTVNISLWSDFDCNYSTWRLFNPYITFRLCCDDCICSEVVI